jgi:NADH:ubiquinone oxidoreductase subunit 4 (subunit M)
VSLVNCLIFLGFPGSIFFIAEVLFFSFMFDLFPLLCIFLLPFLYLLGPTFFFRTWVNVLFGLATATQKTIPTDLLMKELIIYLGLIVLIFWLGFTWQSFIF